MSTTLSESAPEGTPRPWLEARLGSGQATRRTRAPLLEGALRVVAPLTIGLIALVWELVVRLNHIPHYILPGPLLVLQSLIADWHTLWPSLLITLQVTFMALAVATVGGVGLAILFTASRWLELSLFPFAVILQVTPIIAIAPLILIYVDNIHLALLICAWIVAFFPILSNTTLGLNSADHNLRDLFQLYGASRWQTLWHLRLPSALPYFLGGLKIAGGLSLIGAIVAEFAAGTAGAGSGLAYRILEAGYRLNIPRMFAAVVLISLTGILIFMAFTLLSHLVLRRWHESAVRRAADWCRPAQAAYRCRPRAALPARWRLRRCGRAAGAGRSGHRGRLGHRDQRRGKRARAARRGPDRPGRRAGLAGPGRPAHAPGQGPHLAARRQSRRHL